MSVVFDLQLLLPAVCAACEFLRAACIYEVKAQPHHLPKYSIPQLRAGVAGTAGPVLAGPLLEIGRACARAYNKVGVAPTCG